MMDKINSEDEYEKALARINELMNTEANSQKAVELQRLVSLVEACEEEKHPLIFSSTSTESSDVIEEIDLLIFRVVLAQEIKKHILSLYREERENGVSMDTIARRIGRTSQELREMLSCNNLTLDMISDLLAAVGHEFEFTFKKRGN
jgi:antitoxin component HigA of HigAB toxin-antitoxin module